MDRRTLGSPLAVAVAVATVGLSITAALTLATGVAYDENERRLIEERAEQGSAVLMAAIPSVELPLATSLAVLQNVRGARPDPDLLEVTLGDQVGPDARFASAAVWAEDEAEPGVVLGATPVVLDRPDVDVRAFLRRAVDADGLAVLDLLDSPVPTLGYAMTSGVGVDDVLVYAEQTLPGERTQVPQRDNAFADVDYALYLGASPDPRTLLAGSTPDLPLEGRVADATLPFGDTELLLVMRSRGDLGGDLLPRLPWITAVLGAALTAGAATLAYRLQRRRRAAEALARENERLFAEQRQASVSLQQSLLPGALPSVPGIEIVARYHAGVEGTEVGGDWYDAVSVADRLVAIVGDVSGRGLEAVSVMASVRHATRALAAQGDEPGEVLAKVAQVERREGRGHFATVSCARLDVAGRRLAVASAGHPPPLVVDGDEAWFVEIVPGPPVGADIVEAYATAEVDVPPGATVYLFTDGLFERRGEPIDRGLERLRTAALRPAGDLAEAVDGLVRDLTEGVAADDTAVLALRWTS